MTYQDPNFDKEAYQRDRKLEKERIAANKPLVKEVPIFTRRGPMPAVSDKPVTKKARLMNSKRARKEKQREEVK